MHRRNDGFYRATPAQYNVVVACLSVCPSVRLSVAIWYCIETTGGLIPTCSVAPFFCCDLIPTWQITVVQNYDIVNSLQWSKIGDLTSPNIHQNQLFRSSAVDSLQHFPNPSRPSIAGGREGSLQEATSLSISPRIPLPALGLQVSEFGLSGLAVESPSCSK